VCSLIYAACPAHAPYNIATCGLTGCSKFFRIVSQTAGFSKKKEKVIEHKLCSGFSPQHFSEIFLILRRSQQDIIINVPYTGVRVQYLLLSDFTLT
jgi:hypothetical protein